MEHRNQHLDPLWTDPRRQRQVIGRRGFLRWTVSLAGAGLLLSACQAAPAPAPTAPAAAPTAGTSPSPQSAASPAAAPASAVASGAPKSGGTLTLASPADVANFDPFYLVQNNTLSQRALYDSLILYDQQMKPVPQLAQSWKAAADGKSIEIKLRPGVKFHSGREVQASDVAYSVNYVKDKKHGSQLVSMFQVIDKVETPDSSTVVFQFSRPYPAVFDLLYFLFVLDQSAATNLKAKPAGSGPFVFGSWEPGNQLTLKRNPHYWDAPRPYLDQAVFRAIPDKSSLVTSLQSGDVDLIWNFQLSQYVQLAKDPKLKVDHGLIGATYYDLTFNVTKEPFTDKRVRQAINFAIDREQFVKTVLYGASVPTDLPFPPYSIAYSKDLDQKYTYNLDQASSLLKAAGKQNLSFAAIASSQEDPESVALAQIIQASLKKIGVAMDLQDLESARYLALDHASNFQMMMHTFGRSNTDPDTLIGGAIVWRSKGNITKYSSAEYTKLTDEAGSTTDVAKRKSLYRQVAQIMLDDCWDIPVAAGPQPYAYAAKVQGFAYDRSNTPLLQKVWLGG